MTPLNVRLIVIIGTAVALAGSGAAQPVVVTGTGDPNVDVPAVQAAVDKGGHVLLTGRFSFDRPPTTPDGTIYSRMVTVSKKVVISGTPDANGDMPTIEGGNRPFFVDAGNAYVTIQNLHLVGPGSNAIFVYSAGGLTVTGCKIESVQPTMEFGMEAGQANPLAGAIFVGADPVPPSATHPGKPENFSGILAVVNNDIDVGALPGTQTLGVVMFSVGKSPGNEVDIYVSGNNIRNVSEPAINFRVMGGRVFVERNLVTTGNVGTANSDAIRIVGSGSYLIAHNTIDCGWTDQGAAGITVFGQSANFPEAGAIIVDNDVTMSAAGGTIFGANSAGIGIRGTAQGNSALNNRIRGHARAALAVIDQNGTMPGNTSFVGNDLTGFQSSVADVFVDAGVTNTSVIGRKGSVEDHGDGTIVVPRP